MDSQDSHCRTELLGTGSWGRGLRGGGLGAGAEKSRRGGGGKEDEDEGGEEDGEVVVDGDRIKEEERVRRGMEGGGKRARGREKGRWKSRKTKRVQGGGQKGEKKTGERRRVGWREKRSGGSERRRTKYGEEERERREQRRTGGKLGSGGTHAAIFWPTTSSGAGLQTPQLPGQH